MLMSGSSAVATPSFITIVFCSSSRCGWVGMSKSRVIENRLSSIRPTEMSLTGRPRIGSPAARSAVANSSHIMVRRHILRFEMDFGDAAVIAGDQAVEDFGEPDARAPVDPAHDPEVDRGDPPVGQREQIAVVKVGVEEAVDHRLAKEGADQDRGERLAVLAGRDQRVAVVELDAVEPFERQHAPRGPPPVDLRHVIAGLGDHVLAQLGGRRGLALQVELARGPLAEMRDDQPRAQPLRPRRRSARRARRPIRRSRSPWRIPPRSRDEAP